jgi:membrane-associated phospholipid phosphatase
VTGYTDVLALHRADGWWGSDASAPRGLGQLTNELAAFPSLHAGWSLWVALVVQSRSARQSIRLPGWIYALLTAAVVVGTANHWVADVLGGWLICAVP